MPTNPHITHQRACNTLRELIAALAPIAQDGEHSAAYINARLREALRDFEASEMAWRALYAGLEAENQKMQDVLDDIECDSLGRHV